MPVDTKRLVVTSVIVALSVVCLVLGNIIETNTLFLVSLASYFLGFIIRAFGSKIGMMGYVATAILGAILVPNKFYVGTYVGLGFYIVFVEILSKRFVRIAHRRQVELYFWAMKYFVFNTMFIPTLFLFSELLVGMKLERIGFVVIIVMGQIGLFIYDSAYEYFMRKSEKWNRIN
ncbi:MAG: hypothetical protein R3Y58_01590 [Eubacteriales bacterium]